MNLINTVSTSGRYFPLLLGNNLEEGVNFNGLLCLFGFTNDLKCTTVSAAENIMILSATDPLTDRDQECEMSACKTVEPYSVFSGFGSASIFLINFLHREFKKDFKLRTKSTNSEMNHKIANLDSKQKFKQEKTHLNSSIRE